MPVPILVTLPARLNPVTALASVLVLAGVTGMMWDRSPAAGAADGCDPAGPDCDVALPHANGPFGEPAPTLRAATACLDVGYLCADLAESDRIQVRRWRHLSGTLVVHVPQPDFEDAGAALELQRAAAQGIRAWNNEPFPILVDMRGDRDPDFTVEWRRSLGGSQIGMARTRWSPTGGLLVASIELTTRNPFRQGEVSGVRQVRLTAAHEMGHALGLSHSDSSRDVMYPTNTASTVSARDRRTMEVLYGMQDGTEILR